METNQQNEEDMDMMVRRGLSYRAGSEWAMVHQGLKADGIGRD
jgi:hypothetical protein